MRKIFIITITLLVSTIIFELFLQFSPFGEGVSPVIFDGAIGMWHKPNFTSHTKRSCYDTKYYFDNLGRIKNIYPYNEQNKDVVLLGDSFIEAIMVKNADIIHNQLAKLTNNNFNYLNYGLSGATAATQYFILKAKVNLNNAQQVIQFINLDTNLNKILPQNNQFERPKPFLIFNDDKLQEQAVPPANLKTRLQDFLGNFESYGYLKKSIYYYKNKLSRQQETTTSQSTTNDLAIKYLQGSILATKKLLDNKRIEYLQLIYSQDAANKISYKKFLDNNSISYIDLNLALAKYTTSSADIVYSCDNHFNEYAHYLLAKFIVAQCISR